jgi:hypothetical protein
MNALYEGIDKIVAEKDAEIAALQADNARMRGFIETVSLAPTPEDPQARLEGIVARARQALSTPAPAGAFVTLESGIDPVTIASCRNRATDIIWGPEGNGKTCGDVRMILESEYGVEVCRKALGPDEVKQC